MLEITKLTGGIENPLQVYEFNLIIQNILCRLLFYNTNNEPIPMVVLRKILAAFHASDSRAILLDFFATFLPSFRINNDRP